MGEYINLLINKKIDILLRQIIKTASNNNTKTGFFIGNTAKLTQSSSYVTPLRNLGEMTGGGAIVYSEKQAIKIAKFVDGKVDYILVDAEQKIPDDQSIFGDPANTERAVRENINKSTLLVYKGNDISVDAVDSLLSYYYKDNLTGLGGKKIAIIGAGNLGSKLALKLVERGANIIITRRNKKVLELTAKTLNYIKPKYTKAKIKFTSNNINAAKQADILIGSTNGIEAVNSKMVGSLAPNALIIEAGKGSISYKAIKLAKDKNINIFRLDVTPALHGLVSMLLSLEEKLNKKMGRRLFHGEHIVSGGILGSKNEFVVDNINKPLNIFGIADGKGDFIKKLNNNNYNRLKRLKKFIKKDSIS